MDEARTVQCIQEFEFEGHPIVVGDHYEDTDPAVLAFPHRFQALGGGPAVPRYEYATEPPEDKEDPKEGEGDPLAPLWVEL